VASRFIEGIETVRREHLEGGPAAAGAAPLDASAALPTIPYPTTATPAARAESRGLALFAGATLDTVEGGERFVDVQAFLRAAAQENLRREAYIGALRTAGAVPGRGPDAGAWLRRRLAADPPGEVPLEPFDVRGGFTDVGSMLVAFVPWAAR